MQNGHAAGTRFISLGEFSRLAGISLSTARYHADSGSLQVTRTLGGHRRIEVGSAYEWLGLEPQGLGVGKNSRVLIYCRTSSPSQRENISRQVERMTAWACERFDLEPDELVVIQECGSAFSARKGLNQAVDLILAGEISFLCYEVQDRLFRVGSEGALLRHIAAQNGVKLLAAKSNIDDSSEKNMLVTELVDYMTVICNRISAQKASNTLRVRVADEVKDIILRKFNAGESINAIHGFLRDNGYQSNRGREYSYSKIRDVIKEQTTLAELQLPEEHLKEKISPADEQALRSWAKDTLVFSLRSTAFTRLAWESFGQWCRENGFSVPSRHQFQSLFLAEFTTLTLANGVSGYRIYRGAEIKALSRQTPPRTGTGKWLDRMSARIKAGRKNDDRAPGKN